MRSPAIDALRVLATRGPLARAALAEACGVSRLVLGRCLARLTRSGLARDADGLVSLPARFDFLDASAIAASAGARRGALDIEVLDRCGSTNSLLLERARDALLRPVLLLAEEQIAGRGRPGRRWLSALGNGLAMSLLRRMRCPPRQLAGLSLACGVGLVRALQALDIGNLALKWPNDLLCGAPKPGAKIGGILVESRIQGAEAVVVVGIGINCRGSPGLEKILRRRVASLADLCDPPPRNLIAGSIARELLAALERFETSGLAAFRDEWESLHAHAGRRLRVRLADGRTLAGIAQGIAEDGGLLLRAGSEIQAVRSGHVLSARGA